MKNKKAIILLSIYCIGVVFTYGYTWKQEYEAAMRRWPNSQEVNEGSAWYWAIHQAFLWPIYWPLHLSRLAWNDL